MNIKMILIQKNKQDNQLMIYLNSFLYLTTAKRKDQSNLTSLL